MLASFKQHGSDATISGAGAISGGTSLPADSFTYWDMTSRRMGTMISDVVTATTATEGSPASNATEPELTYKPESGDDMLYFGDFNGNNTPDFANTQDLGSAHSGVCDIDFYLNPEGSETPVDAAWFFGSCPWEAHAIIGDFNGDGNSDLSAAKRWSSSFPKEPLRSQFAQQGYGTGDHFLATAYLDGAAIIETSVVPLGVPGATNPNISDNEAYPNLVADFDGDGRDDVLRGNVFLSTGDSFVEQVWANQSVWTNQQLQNDREDGYQVGDVNGDGAADILIPVVRTAPSPASWYRLAVASLRGVSCTTRSRATPVSSSGT